MALRLAMRAPMFRDIPLIGSAAKTMKFPELWRSPLLSDDVPLPGEATVTKDEAWNLANDWVAAWNAHDLDAILSHYDDAVELTSPVAARLLAVADGKVAGKAALRAYFARGLAAYPDLHFSLEQVFCGLQSVVLVYVNQAASRTAEFMELSPSGKVARVVANYSA
jgi:hypothetical protein